MAPSNVRFRGSSGHRADIADLVQRRAGALVIGTDAFLTSHSEKLAALALRHALPAVYQFPEFTAAGGLMSYGSSSLAESNRVAGAYVGRILKGEKPADLPVQQITKVELIINLRTANSNKFRPSGCKWPSLIVRARLAASSGVGTSGPSRQAFACPL
jgi:ABC-type uncharacterized transport system substrate-binding protein